MEALSNDQIANLIKNQHFQNQWFQAKAKVYADIQGDQYSLTAHIKIHTGQLIEVILRKIGLEVARVYITPDSIVSINRLEKTYQIDYNDSFSQWTGTAFNIHWLEHLIKGNAFIPDHFQWKINKENKMVQLRSQQDQLDIHMLFSASKLQMERLQLINPFEKTSLNAKFSHYQLLKDNKYFSYFRVYELQMPEDAPSKIEIQFTEIQLDTPFDCKIEVPARYQRI